MTRLFKQKFNRLISTKILRLIVIVLCVTSCSDSDPDTPTPTPPNTVVPAGDDGGIIFEVTNENGGDNGSSASLPAEVTADEPLNVTISQNSSYLDPDGTTFNCNPKATIKVSANLDTVFAKDIASLTKLIGTPSSNSSNSGDNPKNYVTEQSFNIGGQVVQFDLGYEIYTHTNSKKQSIEMPYVKVNKANFGANSSTEALSRGNEGLGVRLADISVVPRQTPLSRSITVTDTLTYEVTARFNLDIESKNSAADTKQTLSFEVKYLAIVEETNEYDGAVLETSVTKNGESTNDTKFNILPKESLNLVFTQNSSYTDQNGTQATTMISTINITSPDTITVGRKDSLTNDRIKQLIPIATEGFDHLVAPMPYYEFSEISLTGFNVTTVEETNEKEVYKVTATFSQTATPVNVETATTKPKGKKYTYTVTFYAKVIVTLVDTEYISYANYSPELGEGQIVNAFQWMVERHRKYSNGKVKIAYTGTPNWITNWWLISVGSSSDEYDMLTEEVYSYWTEEPTEKGMYCFATEAIAFRDKSQFDNLTLKLGDCVNSSDFGNWDEYTLESSNYVGIKGEDCDDLNVKWYKYSENLSFYSRINCDGYHRYYSCGLGAQNYCAVIDGNVFNFPPAKIIKANATMRNEYNEYRGEMKIVEVNFDIEFQGRLMQNTHIDTIFVKQEER